MTQRGISLAQSLLRAQLGQRVNVMILEKALTLDLTQFEDSEFYDKLTRARREASSRPLSLVMRTFGLLQNCISLDFVRRPAGALLAVGGGAAGAGRAARLSRRSEVLRRGFPAVPLARARIAHANLPRVGAGARRQRQGGEALSIGTAVARSLSGHLHAPVPRGSRSHRAPRCLGLRPRVCSASARSTAATAGSPWKPCWAR